MTDQAYSLGPLRPPAADVAAYHELRAAGRAVTRRLTKSIPPRAHKAMGDALGLLRDGQLRFPCPEAAAALTEACLLDWIERQWPGVGIAMSCVASEEERVVMDESLGDLPDAHGTWVAARYTHVRGFWMTLGTPLVLGKGHDFKLSTFAAGWDDIRMFGDCHHKAALLLMRMGLQMLAAQAGEEYRPEA